MSRRYRLYPTAGPEAVMQARLMVPVMVIVCDPLVRSLGSSRPLPAITGVPS